jgi:hypothetical protein
MNKRTSHLNKKDVIVVISLFFVLFFIYSTIGIIMSKTVIFDKYDVVFDTDVCKITYYLTSNAPRESDFTDTCRHPLFLVFNPIASKMSNLIDRKIVAVLFTSLFGSGSIGLFYILLRKKISNLNFALFFSLLLAFSWSNLFFSSMPETFIFSCFSLLLLLNVCFYFKQCKMFPLFFVLAAVFSIGMTFTNAVLVIILLIYLSWYKPTYVFFKNFLIYGFLIFILLLICSTVQKQVYPKSYHILQPHSGEFYWVNYNIFKQPMQTASQSMPQFFLYNVVAPELKTYPLAGKELGINGETLSFVPFSEVSSARLALLLLLSSMILAAGYFAVRHNLFKQDLFLLLLLNLGWNILFHHFYHYYIYTIILYSAHYTFLLVGILALAFNPFFNSLENKAKFAVSLLSIMLLLAIVINNLSIMFYIYNLIL